MQRFIEQVSSLFHNGDIVISGIVIPLYVVLLLFLGLAAFGAHMIAKFVFLPILISFVRKTKTTIDDFFVDRHVFKRAVHLIPVSIISAGLPFIFEDRSASLYVLISKALSLYYILIVISIYDAVLNAVRDIFDKNANVKKVGITGVIQALKIIGIIVAVILAISVLAGKSPIYFLSGLGAFTAILMLIFKDPILGLVAGVQLSTMDLVRKGDWLEIPKHGADGDVVDITLTTVKVRNFDQTFTAVPAYELISSSFKNWRGMSESGGRRIKRSIRFSAASIRFLTDDEIERLRKIKLIGPYIDEKMAEIGSFNEKEFAGCDMSVRSNGRRLSNIGTFRAYCEEYLRRHPGINQKLIHMVRQLQPTEVGLPLEIYAFTSDTGWIAHENVQSDIFDHFLAIVPEFGLVIYQR